MALVTLSEMQFPGDRIRALMLERGWTQHDLSEILGRPRPSIANIINGKKAITPETAIELGKAFSTGPEYWMQLESAYRLSLARLDNSGAIERRVALYDLAPVKEMERRGWIKPTDDTEALDRELCRFFDVESLDVAPQVNAATRRTTQSHEEPLNSAQRAWVFRAKQLACVVHAEKFSPELLPHCQDRLRELAAFPDEARDVAKVLAGYGIRFVVVEPLTASRIDGAAFWLEQDKPAIAISARYDRIDAFWFTLAHEFAHIVNGDASIDAELVGEHALLTEAKSEIEQKADAHAASILVPPDKLQSFILRVSPLYSKARINQFAHRMKIHPGIIVGQLHHRGEVKWSANREMLAKVRHYVTSTALTDGWGKSVAVDL